MSLDLPTLLDGAVVMAPMTKGSNLPYRRLCDELGATVTMGEMALSRKLKKGSRAEFALIRRHPSEKVFGVQLAGRDADEMAWAAALAVDRGADLVDINLGCPIQEITRRGLGAVLLEKPRKVCEMVRAMKMAVGDVPVTVKIRLAWSEGRFVHVKVAKAAVDGGADAIFVHGRTRQARYRRAADWDKIGEVVEAVPVPVVGNGDIQFPHEIEAFRAQAGCAGVMVARGALIKPWIFKEAADGEYWDISAAERVAMGRRYVDLCKEHWGEDERGLANVRRFLLWHLDFWYRYVPRYPDGRFPKLQEREEAFEPRSELDAVLSRPDPAAHAWIADLLIHGEEQAGPMPDLPSEEDLEAHRDPIPQG